MSQQAITANRLRDGIVVFLTPDGTWSEWIAHAAVTDDDTRLAALTERAQRTVDDNEVVEPYAIEVTQESDTIVPVRLRERIRAQGPTVHPDHGRQAETQPAHAA